MAEKEQVQSFKQVESVLAPLGVDNRVKADVFDAYFDTPNEEAFTKKFKGYKIPDDAKAALWDLRFGQEMKQLGETKDIATPAAMGRVAVAEAPAIGGAVGGLTMGIPGAVAGGIVGQGVKRALQYRKGETPPAQAGEFATDVGLEGAKQGAFEGAGQAAGAALGALRKPAAALYKGSLKFPELGGLEGRELERALGEQKEVAKRGLETRTPGGKKGARMVEERVSATKPLVTAEVKKATEAGKTIATEDYLAPMREQIQLWSRDDPAEAVPLQKQMNRIMENLRSKGMDQWMTPEEAQSLKESLSQQLSSKAFRQSTPSAGKIAGKTARYSGLKTEIEKAVPGVEALNRSIHQDLALKDAILKAEKAHPGFLRNAASGVVDASVLGTIGYHGLAEAYMVRQIVRSATSNPAFMSRLAILLDRAGATLPKFAGPVVKQVPRFGTSLLEEMPATRFEPQNEQANEVK